MIMSHGGDFGDLVYAMSALCDLWLETGEKTRLLLYPRLDTRAIMDKAHAEVILPLIRKQPYIESADWSGSPKGIRLDCSVRQYWDKGLNLADMVNRYIGLPLSPRQRPWLFIDNPVISVPYAVINRSFRGRSQFNWRSVYEQIKRNSVFIGLRDEHDDFCKAVGPLPFSRTATLLDAARLIAGANVFIGNQSCCQAIAEGLKRPIVIERPTDSFCTHWDRQAACYSRSPKDKLPNISVMVGAGDFQLDHTNLAVGVPEQRMNTGLIAYGDGYLLAVRVGSPATSSSIWLTHLDSGYVPTGECHKLVLEHPDCHHSQEDPRLYRFDGKLRVSFTGTARVEGKSTANVLYAELDDELQVSKVWHPNYAGRNPWEKNWAFFQHASEQFAVYSIRPHRILLIDGAVATLAHETPGPPQWSGGDMRGGAAPVLVGDYWYHWFHGTTLGSIGIDTHYQLGCVKFENKPPFRVVAYTPTPLLEAVPGLHANLEKTDVVFTSGAVYKDGEWTVACSFGDRFIKLRKWQAADVERLMVNV